MGLIIQKFGGTSVEDYQCIMNVVSIIHRQIQKGNQVVAVVSAQGDTTDRLLQKIDEITQEPHPREADALVTAGEQISAALLAISLNSKGIPARSLNAFQAGIETTDAHGNATILSVNTERLKDYLGRGEVLIITGFQGISNDEITTLGRGGSDTSAVVLASFLNADRCQFFKDVDGIYDKDPHKYPDAVKFYAISYDDMLKLCDSGSEVLQKKCVEFAKVNKIPLEIHHTFSEEPGTIIQS